MNNKITAPSNIKLYLRSTSEEKPNDFYEEQNNPLAIKHPVVLRGYQDGPQSFLSPVISKIDWNNTDYSGRVVQTYSHRITKLTLELNDFKPHAIKEIFTAATGSDRSFLNQNLLSEIMEGKLPQESINEIIVKSKSCQMVFFEEHQTEVFNLINDIYSKNSSEGMFLINHFKRILRLCSSNDYYGEDALLILCVSIEGVVKYLLPRNKKGEIISSPINKSEIRQEILKSTKQNLKHFHNRWNETRNALAHGAFEFNGRPVSGSDYVYENIDLFFEAFFALFCMAIKLDLNKISYEHVYSEGRKYL